MKCRRCRQAIAVIALITATLSGCDREQSAPETGFETASVQPSESLAEMQGPVACDSDWFETVEALTLVGDAEGHGPDAGSFEWRQVVSRKLGVPVQNEESEPDNQIWCENIAKALGGLHALGYRDILVGDAIVEHPTVAVEGSPGADCQYGRLPDHDGLSLLIVSGELARIDVSGTLRLPDGIGVGSDADELRARYGGRLTTGPSKYDQDTSVYSVTGIGGMRLLFEASNDRVTRYRVGRLPEIEWVEGCL